MQQTIDHPISSLLKNVRPEDVVKATFTISGVVLAALLLYRFTYILFSVVVAIMLYLAVRPLVELLNRRGVNRRVGMIVGYVVVVFTIVGFLLLLVPLVLNQARAITEKLPEYYTLLKELLVSSNISLLQLVATYLPAELSLERIPSLFMAVPETQGGATAVVSTTAISPSTVFATLFLVISIFAMAYYWMRDSDKFIYQFLLFFPAAQRESVKKLIEEMETKVGWFYQGQLILCAMVGGVSFIVYWLIGLPYALTLGVLAFVFEAVPLIGPLLGAVPAVLIALTISPTMTFEVIATNAVVQLLENNILVPRVMDRTVGVNPIVTVLAIVGFSSIFGMTGALLAVPLAAIIQVVFERTIFHFRPKDDDTTATVRVNLHANQRNRFSVVRIEAQDLANDIRKRMRIKDPSATSQSTRVEELIESFAIEFDQLLAKREDSVKRTVRRVVQ